jgi:hypothetical protein
LINKNIIEDSTINFIFSKDCFNDPFWNIPSNPSYKKYRIKTFDVDYSEEVIEDLKQRVENIREFINTINI